MVRWASYNGACCFYLSWVKQCYVPFRPEILKQEIKVFFVKYNDPIYVKLEKLDIMIRLASQANIAQVSSARSDRSCMCSGHGRNPLVPEGECVTITHVVLLLGITFPVLFAGKNWSFPHDFSGGTKCCDN